MILFNYMNAGFAFQVVLGDTFYCFFYTFFTQSIFN